MQARAVLAALQVPDGLVLPVVPPIRSREARTPHPRPERSEARGPAPLGTRHSHAETWATVAPRPAVPPVQAAGSRALDGASTDRVRCCRGACESPCEVSSPRPQAVHGSSRPGLHPWRVPKAAHLLRERDGSILTLP